MKPPAGPPKLQRLLLDVEVYSTIWTVTKLAFFVASMFVIADIAGLWPTLTAMLITAMIWALFVERW